MTEAFAIDQKTIEQLVLKAVKDNILSVVENMAQDPVWLAKIEQLINQTVTYQTIAKIGSMDINTIIKERVDENMDRFHQKMREDFSSIGISDQATQTQLTIMDDHTVFENNLTAKDLTIADSARIQNLVVTGSINTDNFAWDGLSAHIAKNTLTQVAETLQPQMVDQVTKLIEERGIEFTQVKLDGEYLVSGDTLNRSITKTNIQKLGLLENLKVDGPASIYETFNVVNKRIGINTEEPEMALSVWDEEVALSFGKHKLKEAYIGTSRAQGLTLGVNRVGYITVDADGLTTIKKLQVGLHKIGHDTQVPGWAGTRGDIIFNSNPTNNVFAWVCLGSFKWQPLKSAE